MSNNPDPELRRLKAAYQAQQEQIAELRATVAGLLDDPAPVREWAESINPSRRAVLAAAAYGAGAASAGGALLAATPDRAAAAAQGEVGTAAEWLSKVYTAEVEHPSGTLQLTGATDVTGDLTVSGSFPSLIIDETGAGDSVVRFEDGGTAKWELNHDASETDGDLRIRDRVNDTNIFAGVIGTEVAVLNVPFRLPAITTPSAPSAGAYLYVDSADGDLKVRFSNGSEFTLQAD